MKLNTLIRSSRQLATALAILGASAAQAGNFSINVVSTDVQGDAVGGAFADNGQTSSSDLAFVVQADSSHPLTTAQGTVTYTLMYTPQNGDQYTGSVFVTLGFENTLSSSNSNDGTYALDINDDATVVDNLDPQNFDAENGASAPFGAMEVQVYPTLQPDGTYQATFSVPSNTLKASVPLGSNDFAVAAQQIHVAQIALASSGMPQSRQRPPINPRLNFKYKTSDGTINYLGSPSNYPGYSSQRMAQVTSSGTATSPAFRLDLTATATASNQARAVVENFGFNNSTIDVYFTVSYTRGPGSIPASISFKSDVTRARKCTVSYSGGGPRDGGQATAQVGGGKFCAVNFSYQNDGDYFSGPAAPSYTSQTVSLDATGHGVFKMTINTPSIIVSLEGGQTSSENTSANSASGFHFSS